MSYETNDFLDQIRHLSHKITASAKNRLNKVIKFIICLLFALKYLFTEYSV